MALSCGGSVARAADRGERPVVVGVFTGPPDPGAPLSEVARQLHARWGLGDDAWLARRGEDERACAILGAGVRWLPYRDAPYRGYDSREAVLRPPPEDEPLIRQLADELLALWRETPRAVAWFPLGVGGHVDHRICHAAGAALESQGVPVCYYEDFPYAAMPGQLDARRAELAAAYVAEPVEVTAWIDRRARAVEAYASQVGVLFGPEGAVPASSGAAIRRHAAGVAQELPGFAAGSSAGDERFAERVYSRPELRPGPGPGLRSERSHGG